MAKMPRGERVVRTRAYTISTRDPNVTVTIGESLDRSFARLTIQTPQQIMTADLDKAQWSALTDLRYEVDIDDPPEPEPEALEPAKAFGFTQVKGLKLGGLADVPPPERVIEVAGGVPDNPPPAEPKDEEPPF